MSTRSLICLLQPNLKDVLHVYCHSDGYPEWTGRILQQYFNAHSSVLALLEKDLRGIGNTGHADYFADGDAPYADPLHELHEVAATADAEWIYLWQPLRGSKAWAWHVATNERNAERRRDYRPVIKARYTQFEVLRDKLNNLGAFVPGASTAPPAAAPAEMYHPQFR